MAKYMNCPKCDAEMIEEDVLVGRTTHVNEDEVWDKVLICEECGYEEDMPEPDYDSEAKDNQ